MAGVKLLEADNCDMDPAQVFDSLGNRTFPYLQPAEAHATMAYYFDHQDEIDREIEAEWQQVEQTRTQSSLSPFFLRMRAKGLL